MRRFETVLAVRVDTTVATTLKHRARADDRPLSSYLRRLLTTLATEPEPEQPRSEATRRGVKQPNR